jgi:hypothetical protein
VFGAMEIGSMGCGADPAVLFASRDDVDAAPAPPRVDRAVAEAVGSILVTAIVALLDGLQEDVVRAFEHGEFGASDFELDAELSKSGSCRSVT